MKITFTKTYLVKDGTGTTYKEGQTVDFNETSANHFLRRNVAVPYVAAKMEKAREPKAPK